MIEAVNQVLKRYQNPCWWPLVIAVILVLIRWLLSSNGLVNSSLTATGPAMLLEGVFALGLLTLVLLVAAGMGWKGLKALNLKDLDTLEQTVFALALGLGVLAYGVFGLGLIGRLDSAALVLCLILAAGLAWREVIDLARKIPGWIPGRLAFLWNAPAGIKLAVSGLCLILGLTLLHALAPPWDVDSHIYHLQGPRLFLEAGAILPLKENWLTFYPFTVQMLFTLGLALGSESFARLVHLSFAVLMVLATFAIGRRFFADQRGKSALLGALVLVGIPIFPIWASAAYIDMGWGLFEFLALFAVLRVGGMNLPEERQRWLVLAGA